MSEELNVLIVDDDPRVAKTLMDILSFKGYQTEVAFSGMEALEKVAKVQFDFVLTDIKMPDMNGVELYRAIKRVQPDIPVVFMTAYSANKLVNEGLQEGAVAALTKPLNIYDLKEILRKIPQLRLG